VGHVLFALLPVTARQARMASQDTISKMAPKREVFSGKLYNFMSLDFCLQHLNAVVFFFLCYILYQRMLQKQLAVQQ
jgi:hypothetical protein